MQVWYVSGELRELQINQFIIIYKVCLLFYKKQIYKLTRKKPLHSNLFGVHGYIWKHSCSDHNEVISLKAAL